MWNTIIDMNTCVLTHSFALQEALRITSSGKVNCWSEQCSEDLCFSMWLVLLLQQCYYTYIFVIISDYHGRSCFGWWSCCFGHECFKNTRLLHRRIQDLDWVEMNWIENIVFLLWFILPATRWFCFSLFLDYPSSQATGRFFLFHWSHSMVCQWMLPGENAVIMQSWVCR